jgi:hypothetical protein
LLMTSRTMLEKNGESVYSCLVPDLKGNSFSSLLFFRISDVNFSYITFIMLRYVLSTSNCELVSWKNVESYQIPFCVFWDDHVVLVHYSLDYYIMLIDLSVFNHPWIPGMNQLYHGIWSWCAIEFDLLVFYWGFFFFFCIVFLKDMSVYSFLLCCLFGFGIRTTLFS